MLTSGPLGLAVSVTALLALIIVIRWMITIRMVPRKENWGVGAQHIIVSCQHLLGYQYGIQSNFVLFPIRFSLSRSFLIKHITFQGANLN